MSLVKDMLVSSRTPATFVPSLVDVFTKVEKNVQSRIDQVRIKSNLLRVISLLCAGG